MGALSTGGVVPADPLPPPPQAARAVVRQANKAIRKARLDRTRGSRGTNAVYIGNVGNVVDTMTCSHGICRRTLSRLTVFGCDQAAKELTRTAVQLAALRLRTGANLLGFGSYEAQDLSRLG